MTISIAEDVEKFLEQQVQSGVCSDAGELVNDLIRSLREQHLTSLEVTPELEAWLLESADQPTSPLTASDFEAIRDPSRKRKPQVE